MIYVSYNQELKKLVELGILQNKKDPTHDLFEDDTLLIFIEPGNPEDSTAELIDESFAEQEQFGELLEKDEVDIQYNGSKNKVVVTDLLDVPDRFM